MSKDDKKAIVIYTSRRGSTRQYAEWIAEDLGCSAYPLTDITDKNADIDLADYDYNIRRLDKRQRNSGL